MVAGVAAGHSKFLHAGSATAWVARQKDCSPGFV